MLEWNLVLPMKRLDPFILFLLCDALLIFLDALK